MAVISARLIVAHQFSWPADYGFHPDKPVMLFTARSPKSGLPAADDVKMILFIDNNEIGNLTGVAFLMLIR